MIIRLTFNYSIQVDDREQILLAQELLLGYPIPQPPLYSWLSFIFFKSIGVGLLSLSLLKYILIFLTFYFIHKVAALSNDHAKHSALITYSFLLLPSFGWHMHQGFTHTILLGLGIIMTFYYFLKIENSGELKDYFLLGIAISIGVLSKYSFIIFLTIFFTTIIVSKSFRAKIVTYKFLVTMMIATILLTPHTLWIIDNWNDIWGWASARLKVSSVKEEASFITNLYNLGKAYIGFLSPLILFPLFGFRKFFRPRIRPKTTLEKFLDYFVLIIIIVTINFAIFFDIAHIRVRWLHPILMLFPFWFYIKFSSRYSIKTKDIRFFVTVLISFTLLILNIRIAQNTFGPSLGYYGRLNVPILPTLKELPRETLANVSTIKTSDDNLGAHLLSLFESKEIIIDNKKFNSDKRDIKLNCLITWDIDGSHDSNISNEFIDKNQVYEIINNKYRLYYTIKDIKSCF